MSAAEVFGPEDRGMLLHTVEVLEEQMARYPAGYLRRDHETLAKLKRLAEALPVA